MKFTVSTSGWRCSGTGGSSTIARARSRAHGVTCSLSPCEHLAAVVVQVGERARHVALAQPEQPPDHPVVLPVGRLLGAREAPDVVAVDHEPGVHQGEQHPEQQLGVVGPVRGSRRDTGPAASPRRPLTRRCIARTRRVTRSASAWLPKPIVLITSAVRASRS